MKKITLKGKTDPSYYVYLLRCRDSSLYCGQTINLKKRLEEHNGSSSRASKYVHSRKPAVLVYFEKHLTLKNALKREAEIKKFSKKKKEKLVLQNSNLTKTAAAVPMLYVKNV